MKLDNNNHSVFCLYYHLVLVVKYRRKVFTDDMSQYAKDIFVRLSEPHNISLGVFQFLQQGKERQESRLSKIQEP